MHTKDALSWVHAKDPGGAEADAADVVSRDTGALLCAMEPVSAELTIGMSVSDSGGGIAPSEAWPAPKLINTLLATLVRACYGQSSLPYLRHAYAYL